MGPPLVHPVHLIQSITQCHDNNPSRLDIPRKYNMSLPRAWISMRGPRVHLEVSMTIVSIDSRLTNPFPDAVDSLHSGALYSSHTRRIRLMPQHGRICVSY